MQYQNVYIESIGYELAPNVLTSEDIEARLTPLYASLHLKPGQLEALTGIRERRLWDPVHTMHDGAVKAARQAIDAAGIPSNNIGILVYGAVCRDQLEPATACSVASHLNLSPETETYDVSNACLGVLTGMIQVANAIELGQVNSGLVVACESSRQIMDFSIARMLEQPNMEIFKKTVATLTGGSGAVAVLLSNRKKAAPGVKNHQLLGGVVKNANHYHKLCIWGPDTGMPASGLHVMETDSVGVLTHGVALGKATFEAFKKELALGPSQPDKVICHQVGDSHQKTILETLALPPEKDFSTYRYLGNMGTVSLPITAAIADERGFFNSGELVGFLGIGSGLNCLMLGIKW